MKKTRFCIYKMIALIMIVGMILTSMAGIAESERMTYDEIRDIVFNTMVDGERVFKFPDENNYFSSSGKQFRCNGAVLITVPGIKDGELQIGSLFLVFNKENENQETMYEVESAQQENVFDLIGEALVDYIDFENGGKLTFCMTQALDKETQVLYEYSPYISQFSDKDIFKSQNYDEFDSYEAFREKTYGVLYSANHGGTSASEQKDEPAEEENDKNVVLQKGSKGDDVVKLQNRLNELGYSVGKADGDFGNKTKAAVEQFQSNNGLEVTGIADEKTLEALYSDDAKGNATDTGEGDKKKGIDPEILEAGIEFVSDMALEQTANLWNMSKSALWVGEVYCEDKGNNVYQFGARVYRDNSGKGMGFGEGIAFSKDSKGHWSGKADNTITVYSLDSKIPGELVWSKEAISDNTSANHDGESDKTSLIAAGMKYISNSVMEIAPAILGVSENQCRITEIYCLDKGNNEYQFTARVSRGGPGGYGIGKDLTITPTSGGDWNIVDNNHITMYGGSDTIPGDLIFGDADEASIARGMQILGDELKKLDINGDGELSMDEIFVMK